jgi:hypothetical protein
LDVRVQRVPECLAGSAWFLLECCGRPRDLGILQLAEIEKLKAASAAKIDGRSHQTLDSTEGSAMHGIYPVQIAAAANLERPAPGAPAMEQMRSGRTALFDFAIALTASEDS